MSLYSEKFKLILTQSVVTTARVLIGFPLWQRWVILLSLLLIFPLHYGVKSLTAWQYQKTYARSVVTVKTVKNLAKDIIAEDIVIHEYASNQYSATVSISNPNLNFQLKNAQYTFTFYDEQNRVITENKGTFFTLAGQEKYLVVSKINTSKRPALARLSFSNYNWVKTSVLPTAALVKNPTTVSNELDPVRFVVESGFLNSSQYTIPDVRVLIILRNASGDIQTISERHEYTVTPQERRGFRVIYPGLFAPLNIKAEIILETNPFDLE